MSENKTSSDEKNEVLNPHFPVDEHVEEIDHNGKTVKQKGIYLLPNLFTTGNLFCGFYATLAAQSGFFYRACMMVFIAMILDSLDGRVARLTNTQSKFGEQYDSLADMLTFCVAPAVIAYCWSLHILGKLGWIIAFLYAACGALRLARFNARIDTTDSRYFTGLPSPAAAAVVAGTVWSFSDYGVLAHDHMIVSVWIAAVVCFSGILMFSNVRYYSFKKIDFKGRVHFVSMLLVLLIFIIVFLDPPKVLMLIFLGYACSGPCLFLLKLQKNKKK